MPSESVLKEKQLIVDEMTQRLKSSAGVFVDYSGISVIQDTEMRVKMRAANVDYRVIKNTLMRFAIKNVGFDELDPILNGTTSLAVCNDDPIAPARIVKEYADKFSGYFEIKAGFMDGRVLSVNEVNKIASIPPLPILQAQVLGTMLAPITSLAVVLKAAAEKGGGFVDAELKTDEAPVETVAEAVAEVTKEAPAETVADEAPVETVADAVTEVAEETPAETVAEASVEESAQVPAEAAEEVPAAEEAPAEKPAE